MSDELKKVLIVLGGIAFLSLCIFIGVKAWEAEQEWQAYAAQHCKVKAYVRGRTFSTVTSDGKFATTTESSRTTWICDDGKEYTR